MPPPGGPGEPPDRARPAAPGPGIRIGLLAVGIVAGLAVIAVTRPDLSIPATKLVVYAIAGAVVVVPLAIANLIWRLRRAAWQGRTDGDESE